MRAKVILPKSGMGIEEGTIGDWLKAIGDQVQQGEPLVEVETAKAIEVVEAKVSGRLVAILAHKGETIPVNSTIGEIEAELES
jgi:pyruvate/2-oxoglutarate dehydrogenase complex dihydrolipoamide acyltransferase (E2) component